MLSNFDELIKRVKNTDVIKKVAVVCAHDEHTLEAIIKAEKEGVVSSLLIGNEDEIKNILEKLNVKKDESEIIGTSSDTEAAIKAVAMINAGDADFIMKGKLQTADLLRAVVDKENGLRTGRVMSHIAFNEIPTYHKILAVTDGGMMMYPDVNQKSQIIENAVLVLRVMGVSKPKVAVLGAVETVNPKMPDTVDADKLKKMNELGEIKNCIVEGPISYDLTMSKESAKIKGYESPVTGDADIIVVPDMTTGNILGKSLVYSAGSKMAGMIVGAKVPIVLTSRGAATEEKYLSLVLCAASV